MSFEPWNVYGIKVQFITHGVQDFDLSQGAKKVVSDSPGLVDYAIRLVNSVLNLPDGQVRFVEEFKLQNNCEINLLIKTFLGLVE